MDSSAVVAPDHRLRHERDLAGVDPRALAGLLKPLALYYRHEATGLQHLPPTGALVVSNHSGGTWSPDLVLFISAVADQLPAGPRVAGLAHDLLFSGPLASLLRRFGMAPANRENAARLLASGAWTVVFPGGDFDACRPWNKRNVVDFRGRTGYVRAALDAGVPIVPMVSVGGQETQLFLTRGETLAGYLGLKKRLNSRLVPVSWGLFGLSVGPNLSPPVPAKIVTRVLEPIDLADFGPDPDLEAVDSEVLRRMQVAVDELASRRRFPVLG